MSYNLEVANRLQHHKDLMWYDGPLLVSSIDKESEKYYLAFFVDELENHYRWLVLEASLEEISIVENSINNAETNTFSEEFRKLVKSRKCWYHDIVNTKDYEGFDMLEEIDGILVDEAYLPEI